MPQLSLLEVKNEGGVTLRFEYPNGSELRDVFDLIQKQCDEITIELTEELNIRAKEMDPSHVALVDLFIDKHDLNEADGPGKVTVSLEKLTKALNRVTKEDSLVFQTEEKSITIEFKGSDRRIRIPTTEEPKESELPVPNLDFEAEFSINPKEFISVLKDLDSLGVWHVVFDGTDRISIRGEGDDLSYEKTLSPVSYSARNPAKAMYSIQYLKEMVSPKFGQAKFEWGSDIPLRITYQLGNRSILKMYLAPRIECEE